MTSALHSTQNQETLDQQSAAMSVWTRDYEALAVQVSFRSCPGDRPTAYQARQPANRGVDFREDLISYLRRMLT